MLNKKDYPILEFDSNSQAIIDPKHVLSKHAPIGEKLLVCFFLEAIETLLNEGTIHLVDVLKGENPIEIYKMVHQDVYLVPGRLGAPACAGYLEDFIALGAKKILFCGGAGVLDTEVTVGQYVIVSSAIRDEGTSYHYLPPSREVKANLAVVKRLRTYFETRHVPYVMGKTWTTDAFYRETRDKIALRKSEGAIMVEMEQAAMMAVSEFRKIEYGAILYGGDDVSKEVWDSRGWRSREDIRLELTNHALECLKQWQ